jgi:hypothetical protein
MNRLDPRLKQLLEIAQKAERSSDSDCEVPAFFTGRLLAGISESGKPVNYSLLESMVKRGALFAGIIGLVTLTVQLSFGRPAGGIWEDVPVPGAVLLRVVLR